MKKPSCWLPMIFETQEQQKQNLFSSIPWQTHLSALGKTHSKPDIRHWFHTYGTKLRSKNRMEWNSKGNLRGSLTTLPPAERQKQCSESVEHGWPTIIFHRFLTRTKLYSYCHGLILIGNLRIYKHARFVIMALSKYRITQ